MDYICDVIVPTWNKKKLIQNFVESFISSTALSCRVIVVENGSNDGTKEYLAALAGTRNVTFEIIDNKENQGFVRGINQGLAISRAPYICLANNDLTFTRGWLEETISLFERNPQIGLLNPDSNNLGAQPNPGETIEECAGRLGKNNSGVFMEMPFCVGFCLLIPRLVREKAGMLSEEFIPMFFEDTDYSLKVAKAGYRIGVAKGAYVWHAEHGSLKQLGGQKEQFFIAGRQTFTKKWGKILRLAWVVENEKELLMNLDQAVDLARQGNFVWFMAKDFKSGMSEMFKRGGKTPHSGVQAVPFSNQFDLAWKIIKKKKRYDTVITSRRGIKNLLLKLRFNVLAGYDQQEIKKVKYGLL